jgi:hypothetical protein
MSGWTKLFSSIVTSSIWIEPNATLRVWVALLATADADGLVEGSVPGFANLARVRGAMKNHRRKSLHETMLDAINSAVYDSAAAAIVEKAKRQGVSLTQQHQRQIARYLAGPSDRDLRLKPEVKGNVTVDVSDLDVEQLADRISQVIPEFVHETSDSLATELLEALRRRWPAQRRVEQKVIANFEGRLARRWRKPMQLFGMFLTIATEVGGEVNARLRGKQDLQTPFLADAVTRLHARACQVAGEVRVLLLAGFADGANARWRTLHETAVVSMFLVEKGEAVAERFVRHLAMQNKKAMHQYQEHCVKLGMEPFGEADLRLADQEAQELLRQYDEGFSHDYGWASQAIGKKKVTLFDIECAVEVEKWRPYYTLANHAVHADAKSIYFRIGLTDQTDVLLAGPSNPWACRSWA